MFGVMGTSAAFAQAAKAHVKNGGSLILEYNSSDPTIYLDCANFTELYVESVKNGQKIKQTYHPEGSPLQISIQADTHSEIKITSNADTVEDFSFMTIGDGQQDSLVKLLYNGGAINSLDLENKDQLRTLYINVNSMEMYSASLSGCVGLNNIAFIGNCDRVSSQFASAITAATSNDGKLTVSQGRGAEMVTAAEAKGWTVEVLPD